MNAQPLATSASLTQQPSRPAVFKLTYWLVLAVLLTIVTLSWLQTTGNILLYLEPDVPIGQGWYVLSKLLGLYALVCLLLQMLIGLMPASGWKSYHGLTAVFFVVSVLLHAAFFITGVGLRQGHFPSGLLLPAFDHGFYKTALSLGLIAVWCLPLIVLSGYYRRKSHLSVWRFIHHLAFIVCVFGVLHSYWIGTETRHITLQLFYLTTFALLALTVLLKARSVWTHRSGLGLDGSVKPPNKTRQE